MFENAALGTHIPTISVPIEVIPFSNQVTTAPPERTSERPSERSLVAVHSVLPDGQVVLSLESEPTPQPAERNSLNQREEERRTRQRQLEEQMRSIQAELQTITGVRESTQPIREQNGTRSPPPLTHGDEHDMSSLDAETLPPPTYTAIAKDSIYSAP